MTCELEKIKSQQHPGQNVTNLSQDVTYHCQLSPQLASGTTRCAQASFLSLSLLMAMRCTTTLSSPSRVPWKMNSRKLDSGSMLKEPPTSVTKDLPMPTFATLLKLGTKKPRVWVSSLLAQTPRTPRHFLLPLPKLKSMPLLNVLRRAKPLPSHASRAITLAIFVERKDIGPTNILTMLASQ